MCSHSEWTTGRPSVRSCASELEEVVSARSRTVADMESAVDGNCYKLRPAWWTVVSPTCLLAFLFGSEIHLLRITVKTLLNLKRDCSRCLLVRNRTTAFQALHCFELIEHSDVFVYACTRFLRQIAAV